MARTKLEKKEAVKQYSEALASADALYFVKPTGLTSNESTKLKLTLNKLKSKYVVVKNTLFKRAFNDTYPDIDSSKLFENGEHGVVFVQGDISSPAKSVKEFSEETKKMEILAGIYNKKLVSKSEVIEIASLPSYNEMLAKTLATFNGPVSAFVRLNSSIIQKFVLTVKAVSEKTQ